MQSYRLGYDMQRGNADLLAHRQAWQHTLNAPALLTLKAGTCPMRFNSAITCCSWRGRAWTKSSRRAITAGIRTTWMSMWRASTPLYSPCSITPNIKSSCVRHLLCRWDRIILLAFSTLRRIRQQVLPRSIHLVASSQHIEQGRFDTPVPDTDLPNELGLLSRTFNHMATELHSLYRSLEISVEEKTHHLHEAHQQLEMLFTCSQAMNTSKIDSHCFRHILQTVREYTGISWLALHTSDGWKMQEGEARQNLETQVLPVIMLDTRFGELRWQSEQRAVPIPLMKSVATMLGRGLFSNQAQKHYHQLLLMEERATIARELHDSLAQVLSYLRIQLTLLKHAVPEENDAAQAIITDFSRALNAAYRQLRELLTTFRLTLNQANLPAALQETLDDLQKQTRAKLSLDCQLSSLALDAQMQVHLLQIVREAVLNAIKHAQASDIQVNCVTAPDGSHRVNIRDDGIGIGDASEPPGHYGLNIMRERADRLGGTLHFSQPPGGGTEVSVCFRSSAGTEGK
ncbi:Nitrate/nitrite sensor protein narX [Leclercia adecarboxylata]|uniref:histidine kinase n=1 Tax=Leclercia adecarboxylata TaxID=83655 RepID=A0A4U9IEM6_9ENTR|nr:Nitrate/nitrite sensor protein narX [Leclercia adecarboxylata]